MINILHIINQYNIGGPGKTIINTAKYIDKNRFRIAVGMFVPEDKNTELSKEIRKNGIEFLELMDTRGFSYKNLRNILDYIEKNKISIMHCHGYKSDLYGLITLMMRYKKIVVITTHHGWIRNSLKQIIFGSLTLKGSFLFDHVILVSKDMERHLINFKMKKKKISVLHNAIVASDYKPEGLRHFVRSKLGIEEDEVLLLYVGRLSPEKGSENLLKAFKIISEKSKKAKLIYVGEGTLMNSLLNYVYQENLNSRVKFLGHCKQVQLFYEAADVFICPSDTEGLSNTILEAMAFSLPVIATKVGGNPEIISHERNGILVNPRNPEDLSNAILKLVDNKCNRLRLGSKGHKTIKTKFSFEERTLKLQSLYSNLLKLNEF
jgi:glycosyltransferase involved in cell wall biosynthesis